MCVACRRSDRLSTRGSKTQLPWFLNRCDRHHCHCSSFSLFGRVGVFILVFVLCVFLSRVECSQYLIYP